MKEIRIDEIQEAVVRLRNILDGFGVTQEDYGSRYEDPRPPEDGEDVWFDVNQNLICIGNPSESRGFKPDQIDEAEAYILDTYENEVPF